MAVNESDFGQDLLDGINDAELLEAVELQYISSKL